MDLNRKYREIDTFLFKILSRCSGTIHGILDVITIVNSPSYYPEKKRKSYWRRLLDNVLWVIKYHCSNCYYNLYGQDIVDNVSLYDNYLSEKEILLARKYLHNDIDYIMNGYTFINLTKDKYLFNLFMSNYGLPVPKILKIKGKSILGGDTYPVFIKVVNGTNGENMFKVNSYDELENILKKIDVDIDKYICEEGIIQHKKLNEIWPESVNTLRIVTIIADNQPEIFSVVFRCGTSKTSHKDNLTRGGIAVGVTQDGKLKKYGFQYMTFGSKHTMHPDTKFVFEGMEIPYYKEALEVCLKGQRHLKQLKTIGWDVAITDNGPIIIEGNEYWGLGLMQACNGGLKERWRSFMKKSIKK